jgi:hypothetical protein
MREASTWSFRPATEADLSFLIALRLGTMAPHFARQGIVLSDAEHRLRAEFRLGVRAAEGKFVSSAEAVGPL